jgi:hypothetical protein
MPERRNGRRRNPVFAKFQGHIRVDTSRRCLYNAARFLPSPEMGMNEMKFAVEAFSVGEGLRRKFPADHPYPSRNGNPFHFRPSAVEANGPGQNFFAPSGPAIPESLQSSSFFGERFNE